MVKRSVALMIVIMLAFASGCQDQSMETTVAADGIQEVEDELTWRDLDAKPSGTLVREEIPNLGEELKGEILRCEGTATPLDPEQWTEEEMEILQEIQYDEIVQYILEEEWESYSGSSGNNVFSCVNANKKDCLVRYRELASDPSMTLRVTARKELDKLYIDLIHCPRENDNKESHEWVMAFQSVWSINYIEVTLDGEVISFDEVGYMVLPG